MMTETPDARHFRLAMQSFIGRDKIHNQSTLSITSGVSRSLINEIIHGKRFAGRIAQEKIARACGLSLADFLALGQRMDMKDYSPGQGGRTLAASETDSGEQAPPGRLEQFQLSRKPIPMLGLVECGLTGWCNAMEIAVSSSMLTLSQEAFAVIAEDDSMKPEGISRGMLCYCDPAEEPLKGDAVYVGSTGPNGTDMGTIKIFCGWGTSAGSSESCLKLRGWRTMDTVERQTDYFMEISSPSIIALATVVLVRRRL